MFYNSRHDMVIYPGVDPRPVLDNVPGARTLNGFDAVAVPWRLDAMRIVANLGMPATSPMLRDYDFPIHPGLTPMAHQKAMADFMVVHPRCFVLSDMRTGKTLSALWAFDHLRQLGLVKKCLVIAKLSTLERVWQNELFAHFLGRLRGITLHGSREERERGLDKDAELYIINYDGLTVGATRSASGSILLGTVARRIAENPDISCIIIDESATLRNSATRRWKCIRKIVRDKAYVWQLTGTPTPNAPTDAHGQKRLVFEKIEAWLAFRDRTMFRINQWKWLPRPDAAQHVAKFLQPSIRYERAEVMELPPMIYDTITVPLTKEQQRLMQEMKANLQILIDSGAEITAANEAGLRIKLIQIVCGSLYDAAHGTHHIDATPRLEMLAETIDEAGHKVLVFAPLTSVVERCNAYLNERRISSERIIGAVAAKARADILRRFNDEDSPRVLCADPGTVAHGLDLSVANTVIWFGPTDRVEDYQQANQRISGPKQRRGQLIVHLASTQIERTIFQRLKDKQSLQGLILDLVREQRDE